MQLVDESILFDRNMDHRVTSIGQLIIIYGWRCLQFHSPDFNALWIYNTINGNCRRYPAPENRTDTHAHSSLCPVGDIVYIFGGNGIPFRDGTSHYLLSFDIRNSSWQDLSPRIDNDQQYSPPPVNRSFLCYHDGFLYVLGWISVQREHIFSIYRFSLQTNIWSTVEHNGTTPIFAPVLFGTVLTNQFFTFGYSTIDGPKRFTFINIFDFSTNTWTSRETKSKTQMYPDKRAFESLAFSGSFLFMSGGNHLDNYYSDIWRIDIENFEWIKLEITLETEISRHHMTVINDYYLYIFGGRCPCMANEYMFDRLLLRPPPLYRLCLESISRSSNLESLIDSIPVAIVDELDLNED